MSSGSGHNVWQIRQKNKIPSSSSAISTLDDDEAWPEVQVASSMSSQTVNGIPSASPKKGEKSSSKTKWTPMSVEVLQTAADAHRERGKKAKSTTPASSSSTQAFKSASSSRTASPRNGKPRKLPQPTVPTPDSEVVGRPSPPQQPTILPQQVQPQRHPSPPIQPQPHFSYPAMPGPPYNGPNYTSFPTHPYAPDYHNSNQPFHTANYTHWNPYAPPFYSSGDETAPPWTARSSLLSSLVFGSLKEDDYIKEDDIINCLKRLPLEIGVDIEAKQKKVAMERKRKSKRRGRRRGNSRGSALIEISGESNEWFSAKCSFFWQESVDSLQSQSAFTQQQPPYYPYHVPPQPVPPHPPHPSFHQHHASTPPPVPLQYYQHQPPPPHNPLYYQPPPHHFSYYPPHQPPFAYSAPYDQGFYSYPQPYGYGDFPQNVSERSHEPEFVPRHNGEEDRESDTPLGIPNPTTVLLAPPSPSSAPHTEAPPPLSALPTLSNLRTFSRTSSEGALRQPSHDKTVEEAILKIKDSGSSVSSSHTSSANNTPLSTVNSSSLPTTSATTPPITNSDTEPEMDADQTFRVRNFGYGFGQCVKPVIQSGTTPPNPNPDTSNSVEKSSPPAPVSDPYRPNGPPYQGQGSPVSSATTSPSATTRVPNYVYNRGRSRGYRGRGRGGYYNPTSSTDNNDVPILGQPSYRGGMWRGHTRGRARGTHAGYPPHPPPHFPQQRDGLTTYIPMPPLGFSDGSYGPPPPMIGGDYPHNDTISNGVLPGHSWPYPTPLTRVPPTWDHVRRCLLGQLEFYMSKDNMVKDFYLRQQMTSEGWIPLELFATFPRIRQLTPHVERLREVLEISTTVELSEDRHYARMAVDWEKYITRAKEQQVSHIGEEGKVLQVNSASHDQVPDAESPMGAETQDMLTPMPKRLANGDAQHTPIAAHNEDRELSEEEVYDSEDEEDDVVFVMGEDGNSGGWASSKSSSRQQSQVRV
ncbi:hypothetical protein VNI00_012633 [Paramarasmius palmivorus]|uniref:HTH La-type RNA-binding domain-containing protein n=1 Tax=Paramarasmius palmivorus TaxID=297713 RepID=A0AAW0C2W8_9AGAR